MKIKQLFIKQYGPLQDKEYHFKPGFNLIYGLNEQGKSLTLDALIKLLLGKKSKSFQLINRVADDPAQYGGFVSLEHQENEQTKITKLQGKPNLTDLLPLTADECENLLVVRNSDLSIGQDLTEQDQFYTNLTDRLTGLKAQEIAQAKQQLRASAQITDKTNHFQSTQENLLLGDRLEQARQLLAEEGPISQLMRQDQQRHWSELENKFLLLNQKLKTINRQLKQQKLAQQKQEYQSLDNKIKQFEQLQSKIKPFAKISQDKLDAYRSLQQKLESQKEIGEELSSEIKSKDKQLSELEAKLTAVSQKKDRLSPTQQEIEERIQPKLIQLKEQAAHIKGQNKSAWRLALILSSCLLIAATLAYLFQPGAIILILIIFFFGTTAASAVKYFLLIQQKSSHDTQQEQLRLELAKNDIQVEGKNTAQILQKAQQFKKEFQHLKQHWSSLHTKEDQLKKDKARLQKKLAANQDKIEKTQQHINQLQDQCQVETLAELKEKLEKKQKLNTQTQSLKVLLTEKLGRAKQKQADLKFWQQQLSQKKPLKKEEQSTKFDEEKLDQLRQTQQQTEADLQRLTQQLQDFKAELQELQRKINHVLKNREEILLCETMTDLLQAKKELEQFVQYHQKQRSQALAVIKILDQIEAEEKEKVSQLFGPDSNISQHFADITNNKYDQVIFDQTKSRIKVRASGEDQFYSAEKLSGGGYDQLYFAIRLGLGEKLLGKQQGFFILDDPFLKADHARLQQQLDMLFDFVQKGWQIIYFSAKNEIKDYLTDKAQKIFEASLT